MTKSYEWFTEPIHYSVRLNISHEGTYLSICTFIKILIFGGHLRLFSLLYTCTPNHTSNYGYLKEYAPSCKMKPNKGVCAIYCRQCANNLTTWYKTYGTFFYFGGHLGYIYMSLISIYVCKLWNMLQWDHTHYYTIISSIKRV